MRTFALLAILVLGTGCASTRLDFRAVPRGIEDDDRMVEVIRTLIPAGTPVADAQGLMERQGFDCTPFQNVSFVTQRDWEGFWFCDESEPKCKPQLDYICCCREESAGFMASRSWRVALVHRNGKIVNVLADAVDTGL